MSQNALRDLSYGVYAVTSVTDGKHSGCIANSAMQITSSPKTVAVSINHDNFTNGVIKAGGVFALSILPETVDSAIIGTFGFKSSRDTDKFAEVSYTEKNGLRVLSDAVSYIVCRVVSTLETETHTVFLGEVTDSGELCGGAPMTYAYYHNVIKGTSPKNAPTYIADEKIGNVENKITYRCSICGHVYSGETPFEELPESFTCPVCGVPKSLFKQE